MIDMKKCMLDLETLGTRPGDVILSIGAVLFEPGQGITSELYMTISPQSSKEVGMKAQKSTIEWWGKQDEKTRAEAFKGELSIQSALKQFSMWLPPETLVYGNGANFDNVLLAAAYRAIGEPVPWPYWNDRCYRTLAAMFMKYKTERVGVAHHALDDAKTQAIRLMKMVEENGLVLK